MWVSFQHALANVGVGDVCLETGSGQAHEKARRGYLPQVSSNTRERQTPWEWRCAESATARESAQRHEKMSAGKPPAGRPARKLADAGSRTIFFRYPLAVRAFLNLDLDRALTEVSSWFSLTASPRSPVRNVHGRALHGDGGRLVVVCTTWYGRTCGRYYFQVASHTLLGVRDIDGATFSSMVWSADSFESSDLSRRVRRAYLRPQSIVFQNTTWMQPQTYVFFFCVGVSALLHVKS